MNNPRGRAVIRRRLEARRQKRQLGGEQRVSNNEQGAVSNTQRAPSGRVTRNLAPRNKYRTARSKKGVTSCKLLSAKFEQRRAISVQRAPKDANEYRRKVTGEKSDDNIKRATAIQQQRTTISEQAARTLTTRVLRKTSCNQLELSSQQQTKSSSCFQPDTKQRQSVPGQQ